jgi:hypothetical protein
MMPLTKPIAAKLLAFAVAPLVVTSCSTKTDLPRWRVTSHVGADWTFSRRAVDQTPARRIVASCSSFQWQGHDPVTGEDVCSLTVGDGLAEPLQVLARPANAAAAKLPTIDVMAGNTVAITEGEGPDRTLQLFKIKRDETLP